MKKFIVLLYVVFLAMLILPVVVFAQQDTTLSWTAPTQNTDGSAYTDPAGYKIYHGTVDGGPYPIVVTINNPAVTEFIISGLAIGDHYFVSTAFNQAGAESDYSNQAIKTIVPSVPNPPSGLVVLAEDLSVRTVSKIPEGFLLLNVGVVPAGTPCDSTQSSNGHYSVPISAVTWSDPARNDGTAELPLVVVAQCG